jgi:hypothetical protein
MRDIKNYLDIGKRMLKHPIFKEKYKIQNPEFPGDSLIEKTLWTICKEKEGNNFRAQERSSTQSITRKLNKIFNTGG